MKRNAPIVLALPLAALLLLAGCDSTITPEGDAPTVVPPEAFTADMDLFQDQGASKAGNLGGEHFTAAFFGATLVRTAVGLHLILPKAVTALALHSGEPTLQGDVWTWTGSHTPPDPADTTRFDFTLSSQTDDDHIAWNMHVAHVDVRTGNVIGEFDLYKAETNPNSNEGTWELFYPIDGEAVNVLDAAYTITSSTEKEIVFSVPLDAPAHAGASATFARNGSGRTLTVINEGGTHVIMWDAETKAGSIESPDYNGGVKACWDTQENDLVNVECPA